LRAIQTWPLAYAGVMSPYPTVVKICDNKYTASTVVSGRGPVQWPELNSMMLVNKNSAAPNHRMRHTLSLMCAFVRELPPTIRTRRMGTDEIKAMKSKAKMHSMEIGMKVMWVSSL